MTYTYIEAKSNYHRGSILILRYVVLLLFWWSTNDCHSYLVLTAGFYFAPATEHIGVDTAHTNSTFWTEFSALTKLQYARWYLFSWWPH